KCSFKNVFTRIFIVLFFFTLPCVALSIRYYFLGETTFIIITVVYSVFSFIIIIPGVIVDDCCFHKLNSGFDEFSIRACCERKYGWDIRFPPLIFIIASVAFQCKGKTTKCLCYFFFAAWAFLFTLPASALVFVFATLVAISIFEATYVKSLLAGLLAFLVYVREASNGIRKKHERCLRIITENILESISTTDVDKAERCLRFFTIKGNNPTRHEEGLLIAESCIPYIIVNEKILVKDTAISHILKVKIQKIITFLVLGAFFITSTILLVILFAKWDFISPSNQAFITFITGIIPLVFKIGYSGTSRDSDIFFDKDELEEKLKTYSEQFKKAKEEIQRRDSNGQEQTDLQPNAADSSISPGAGSDDVEEHFNVASETNDKSKKYNAIMADIERGLNISNPRNKDKFTYSFENSDERTPLCRFSV
ncbi:hypothetical protein BgiBS90_027193, partial [Biomphalaria glabrata]